MNATLVINPRRALQALQDSGMPKKQANEVVKIFEEIDLSDLATKKDLETSNAKLKAELIQFMFLQALAIVGLPVTLLKFL